MTHEQFEKAAQYWERKEQTAMPQEALKKRLLTTLPKTTPALWPLAPAITSAAPPLSTASMPSGFPLNGIWKRFCIFNETSNFLNCAVPSPTVAKNLHFFLHPLY